MKTITKILLILIGMSLVGAGCLELNPSSGADPRKTSSVQTIPPGTLTAISESDEENPTETSTPEGLDLADPANQSLMFWYVWSSEEVDPGMEEIVDKFNNENPWGIQVTAVNQGRGHDPMGVVEAALEAGERPDLMLVDDVVLDDWYRRGWIVDLNHYLEDSGVGLSAAEQEDFFQDLTQLTLPDSDVRPGIPVSQILITLLYNQSWGEELGFSEAPDTAEDLTRQSCSAAEAYQAHSNSAIPGQGGLLIYPSPENMVGWLAAYQGEFYLGQEASYQFLDRELEQALRDWWLLLRRECAYLVDKYPDPHVDDYVFEKFNQRQALLVINSSLNLEQIHINRPGVFPSDNWKMVPFPGPDGTQRVTALQQSGVILASSPEKQLASWIFIKELLSPRTQADWSRSSGAYPSRKEAVELLQDELRNQSYWVQGLDYLELGALPPAAASWEIVRLAVGDGLSAALSSPPGMLVKELEIMENTAAELHQKYSP
jgi:ABC-type glycerol-3-phosphate transport system substrate-binding protein